MLNADSFEQLSDVARRLRDVLIESGRLLPEDLGRIEDAMRTLELGFAEAALLLELLTPSEMAEAWQKVKSTAAASPTRQNAPGRALMPISRKASLPIKYAGSSRAGPLLMLGDLADNVHSERMRALRTELILQNSSSVGGSPSLAGIHFSVLSPCRSEGRTQICAELAVAFAQLGRRTLLVDADLRRPRMHSLFEADNSFGLAQALSSGDRARILEVEKLPTLFYVPSGPAPANPLELLSTGHFEQQILEWRDQFDVLIVDTPPVSEFSDGLVVAACVDQVLLVSRINATPHKLIRDLIRRLASTQARIVGAVINEF